MKRIGIRRPSLAGQVLRKPVLGTEHFASFVAELAEETGRSESEIMKEARSCLDEMATGQDQLVNEGWDRTARWAARAYKFDLDNDAIDRVKEIGKDNGLIFLPNHRSYLDPLVLRSALARHGFSPNYLLGGANLSFWPMSSVGHRNGLIFIRRSMKGATVYKAVLREYLSYLMDSGENLEWYIEGGRTRTGKLRQPRLGILNYVIDSFENRSSDKDVYMVPVSIIYDQQHEIESISAEELGGTKSPEDIGWMIKFFKSQGTALGCAHLRFGEPFSLRDALDAAKADSPADAERIAVPKIAFEVCHRINQVTPITPTALLTFALLDNDDRALTMAEGREVLKPLLEYISLRKLPLTNDFKLDSPKGLSKPMKKLVEEGVVSEYTGGLDAVYSITPGRAHEAGFYRNSASHFFITRAILETALIKVAEGKHGKRGNLVEAGFAEARRLRDLLKFEFFFPSTRQFAEDLVEEVEFMHPGWQTETVTASAVKKLVEDSPLHLAHRVLGPFIEAYGVVADRLAVRDPAEKIDDKKFLDECIGVAQQRWLQRDLHSPESISKDIFSGALQVAKNRGLLDPDATSKQRDAFSAEIADVIRRVGRIRAIANSTLRPAAAVG